MTVNIEVPDYSQENGVESRWEGNFLLETAYVEGSFIIKGNKEGLISLGIQLLTLAQDDVPLHAHLHYDDLNSLEEESVEFIIEKAY